MTQSGHVQCSVADIIPARDRHQGCDKERNKFLLSGIFSEYLSLCQGQCASGLYNAATREHPIPGGWGQKIDLKLRGENSDAWWHEAQCCVTSSAICNTCNHAPMHEAVLLRDCRRCGQAISTAPGEMLASCAPMVFMRPCLAKLVLMRASNSGSFGVEVLKECYPRYSSGLIYRLIVSCVRGTWARCRMSAIGTKRTFKCRQLMSAFGGKADITQTCGHVYF